MGRSTRPVAPVVVKLCSIFRKLPLRVTDRKVLLEQAQWLALAAEISRANDHPTHKAVGTRKGADELAALANALLAATRTIGELHEEAAKAMAAALGHPHQLAQFRKELILVHRAAADAVDRMDGGPQTRAPSGARKKKVAKDVTRWAADAFRSLTGLPVTRRFRSSDVTESLEDVGPYGPFHDYLTDVFAALDIKAKADPMIKDLLMAKSRPSE